MKFYRVAIFTTDGSSAGYEWFSRRSNAAKRAKEQSDPEFEIEVSLVEIAPRKSAMLRALRTFASYPDNG